MSQLVLYFVFVFLLAICSNSRFARSTELLLNSAILEQLPRKRWENPGFLFYATMNHQEESDFLSQKVALSLNHIETCFCTLYFICIFSSLDFFVGKNYIDFICQGPELRGRAIKTHGVVVHGSGHATYKWVPSGFPVARNTACQSTRVTLTPRCRKFAPAEPSKVDNSD